MTRTNTTQRKEACEKMTQTNSSAGSEFPRLCSAIEQRILHYRTLKHNFQQGEATIKNMERAWTPYDLSCYPSVLESQYEIAAELEKMKWTAKFVAFVDKYNL